jgi:hypothetical protein
MRRFTVVRWKRVPRFAGAGRRTRHIRSAEAVPEQRWRMVVEKAYDQVNLALWAGLCAVLIFFALFVAPNIPASRAKYSHFKAAQDETEHEFYCKRWGMLPGTMKYQQCMADLLQFRRSVEKQVVEDLSLFP